MRTKERNFYKDSSCYLTEESLVRDLEIAVKTRRNSYSCRAVTTEFGFDSGRTDLLGVDANKKIHAFEAKLTKWRVALDQARRNTSFSHYVYVVLPARSAPAALRGRAEFQRRGVGLLILGGKQPRLEIEPRQCEPVLPWLTDTARRKLAMFL
jgi:hypothetical protein